MSKQMTSLVVVFPVEDMPVLLESLRRTILNDEGILVEYKEFLFEAYKKIREQSQRS